jgi:hypothetical protein
MTQASPKRERPYSAFVGAHANVFDEGLSRLRLGDDLGQHGRINRAPAARAVVED